MLETAGQLGPADLEERGSVSVHLAEKLIHGGSDKDNSQISSLGVLSIVTKLCFPCGLSPKI